MALTLPMEILWEKNMSGSQQRETNIFLILFQLCHELHVTFVNLGHFTSQESLSLSEELFK